MKALIQTQGLQADHPDNTMSVESNYGTNEIPCALNALVQTRIGYQSGGTTFATAADKMAYLESIANGPAYGAQYIELFPSDLSAFVSSTEGSFAMSWNGISNYGTTPTQNINMLSQALAAAKSAMTTNALNSASGALCPLPNSGTGTWSYP